MNTDSKGENTYYNQFFDLKDIIPMKVRLKQKSNNLDNNIKIINKKLPADFFRPYTRQNPNSTELPGPESGNKTPCFGDEKKQSYSLSLIPKDKRNLDFQSRQRISTLPVQQISQKIKQYPRRNCTRELTRNQKQFSHRLSNKRQQTNTEQAQSASRQKIKYKKITLNDQIYLDQKKILNHEYQNRIRLNVKKFFQQQNEFIQIDNNKSKSGRRNLVQLQKISSVQPPNRLKMKRLPPLL